MNENVWRKCSVCKKDIAFSQKYYVCSVSSCSKKRAPVQFCSVQCWDVHNSIMNHKNAGADEEHAPSKEKFMSEQNNDKPRRRIVSSRPSEVSSDIPKDVLVVVSKLKAYINATSGMNTSADVMPVLSDIIRSECDKAVEKAKIAGRKTVMARDF
jgi:hypothetical protein